MSASYEGGRNIAMKVPPHQWEATVVFYRDFLRLEELPVDEDSVPPSVGFRFGANQLWIDRVDSMSQAEMWLEVTTDDIGGAASEFQAAGIARRDEIEPLGDDATAFWVSSPAGIIHLVVDRSDAW